MGTKLRRGVGLPLGLVMTWIEKEASQVPEMLPTST